eukprot:TRINITY_DN252_c0_g1_i1.p1 TRINITY_DN252_c0_g1~~TRINITY_DN252_c0_g1_i1.p1  ORF type:complete len:188 (-),score=46.09 TRINITY_DN252_c0_g1_i1:65-628(-)
MGNKLHSRILVLGIDGAGKTTFLNKYEHPKEDIATQPTESYKIRDMKVKSVKFNVWDVSGKEATRSLWKHYYKEGGTDAVIWVIDSASSKDKLEESHQALNNAMNDPALAGVILLVLANKQDLDSAKKPEEIEKFLDIHQYESKRTCLIRGISSKTGEGIKSALDDLAKTIKTNAKKKDKHEKKHDD